MTLNRSGIVLRTRFTFDRENLIGDYPFSHKWSVIDRVTSKFAVR
jgi:hypothetical protein